MATRRRAPKLKASPYFGPTSSELSRMKGLGKRQRSSLMGSALGHENTARAHRQSGSRQRRDRRGRFT